MGKMQDFKDNLSRIALGMTRDEAIARGVCIECKQPNPLSRCHTDAGRREYYISGMDEECFDKMFEEGPNAA